MATLIHDDIVDGAHVRRGRAAAWTAHGADAARAAGDHLFAAAFAALAATGSQRLSRCSPRRRWRSRAARRSSACNGTIPSTTVDAYLRALCAQDRLAVRGGLCPRAWRRVRPDCSGSRSRSSTTSSTAPARPSRPGRSRHRPARRHADAAAPPRRPRGRGRPAGARRRPARGALVRVAATGALARSARRRSTRCVPGEPRRRRPSRGARGARRRSRRRNR